MTSTTTYTTGDVEAALCVWEWVLDRTLITTEDSHPALNEYRETYGTAQLRSDCVDIGVWVDKVYNLLDEDTKDRHCFDWDVVPEIMEHVTFGAPLPEPETIAPLVAKQLLRNIWMALVNQYAREAYCWQDALDDKDRANASFERGETPVEFVTALAEKFDLDQLRPHPHMRLFQIRYTP